MIVSAQIAPSAAFSRRATTILLAAALLQTGCKPGADVTQATPPSIVRTSLAEARPVEESIDLVGTLNANESVEIRPEVAGIVRSIPFDEGQEISKGGVILEIENDDLRAQVAEARSNLALAESNYSRIQQLVEKRAVSNQDFDEAKNRLAAARSLLHLFEVRLEKTIIEAPFAGRLGARRVSPGQFVNTDSVITTLVDPNPLRAEFSVPERFLPALALERQIRVRVPAYPGRDFPGEVYFVSPFVDESTRTILIRAMVPNPDSLLKPGMFAGLRLVLERRDNAVVVPEEAVVLLGGRQSAYVLADGKVVERRIRTGFRMPGLVEILSGIEAGERVVVSGHQRLRDGAPAVESSTTAPVSPAPGR